MTLWEKAEDALGVVCIGLVLLMFFAGASMLCTPSLPEEDTARFWEQYLEERDGG